MNDLKTIEAAAAPCSTEIKIRANTGKRMNFAEAGDYIIDLGGAITMANDNQVPLLFNHNREKVVGFASALEVTPDGVVLCGKLTTDTDETNNIRASWREGQRWQASLGFTVTEAEDVPDGAEVEINGRTELGPCTIARAITIHECSICSLGADDKTEIITAHLTASINTDNTELNHTGDDISAPILTPNNMRIDKMEEINANNNTRIASLAVLMQAGARINERNYKERELEAANQLKDLDFRSIVEAASGWQATHSQRSNAGEWLSAAASSYGLSNIVTTVSSELLLQYMNSEGEPWRNVFKITSCADQRPNYRYKIGTTGGYELKKMRQGEEFPNAVYDDKKAVISADLYARQCCITEEELLAGNAIGALADIMRQSAAGAHDCIKSVLWGKFLNPTCQFDSDSFFDAGRGNVFSGKALNYQNLAEGVAKFYECNKRGISPRLLIVPASLWATAQTLTKATSFYTSAGSGADVNPIASAGLLPVAVPDLELSKYGGAYSSSTWYLAADPQRLTAFEAMFLNGQTTPRMRRQDVVIGFAGIKFDTSLIFGCASLDPIGIVKFTA